MSSFRVPHSKYFRHRLYPRLRHRRSMRNFLIDMVAALGTSASGQTVSPVRTTNTKAEALVVFGGQPTATKVLTVGDNAYVFVSALTEAKASGLLTFTTNPGAADTVTIDGVTYTFVSALTEAKAAGTLTNDATNAADGSSVTIGSKVYTFQTTLTDVDGHVHIAGTAAGTMTNLFHAINNSGGTSGTDYAASTTANTNVVATNPSSGVVVATALAVGVASNSVATTASTSPNAHATWGGATLTGGVDSIAREVLRDGTTAATSRDHLVEAITAGSNAGTDYSTATVVHPTVTAAASSGNMSATAKSIGTAGNSLATTRVSTHIAWGAATLTGGIDSIANEVLIDSSAANTRTNTFHAITYDAGAGTNAGVKYSTATVAHPKVTAAASGGDMLVTALLAAHLTPGKSVKLASTDTNVTAALKSLDGPGWTATGHAFKDGNGPVYITTSGTRPAGTLAGGEYWVHKIGANTVAFASSLAAMARGDFLQTTSAGTGTHTATHAEDRQGVYDTLKRNDARTVAQVAKASGSIDSLA